MINRCNSLIENNENTENIVMVEKVDENWSNFLNLTLIIYWFKFNLKLH